MGYSVGLQYTDKEQYEGMLYSIQAGFVHTCKHPHHGDRDAVESVSVYIAGDPFKDTQASNDPHGRHWISVPESLAHDICEGDAVLVASTEGSGDVMPHRFVLMKAGRNDTLLNYYSG